MVGLIFQVLGAIVFVYGLIAIAVAGTVMREIAGILMCGFSAIMVGLGSICNALQKTEDPGLLRRGWAQLLGSPPKTSRSGDTAGITRQ